MTGFGNAAAQTELLSVTAELRAVNNRYLKLSLRLPDSLGRFESRIEKLVRDRIARGTIQLSLRVRFPRDVSGYAIDTDALQAYRTQLQSLGSDEVGQVALRDLLPLPGVVVESELIPEVVESLWPTVEQAVLEALLHFDEFRQTEGASMRDDLARQCATITAEVDSVSQRAPEVVAQYRQKLLDRLTRAVEEAGVTIEDRDVIREVALFADRCDINEEITRLRSHLEQFDRFLNSDQSLGRKLEFLGQEMFREINTIGSKANNVEVAHSVVEMKSAIERIREVLQNVE